MKYRLASLALLSIFISCNSNSKKKFEIVEQISWIDGNWNNKLDDGILIENWKKANDSTYTGKSYFVRGKDTLHQESITLIQKDDQLFYIPTVKGQNNDEPIPFKLVKNTETSFIFENNSHDYPQTIEYRKLNDNQLSAIVSGTQNGKTSTDTYVLNRK